MQHLPIKFIISYGFGLWHPKPITVVTSEITDHHNKYNNYEKVWNFVRIIKMWHRDQSEQRLLEKKCWQTCSRQVCHKHSVCIKQFSAKHNKEKYNKRRHGCILRSLEIKKDGAKISRGANLKEYLFLGWEDLSMFLGWREGTHRRREDKDERKMYYHTHVIGETSEGRIKIISRT